MLDTIKNNKKDQYKSYLWLVLGSIFYVLGLQGFLQQARTFPSGLSAFASLTTFITQGTLPYVSVIYLGLNIPLIIIFWKKNKQKFMYRTLFCLVLQAALGTIFISKVVSSKFSDLLSLGTSIGVLQWPIFMMAIMGALLMGFGIAICWKFGGSTGGTDIITYYYSSKRKKSIGNMMMIIGISITIFSLIVAVSFNEGVRNRWLMTLFSSITYVIITSLIVDSIYPKYKKVKIEVVSEKWELISKKLKDEEYWHAWTISKYTSGYSGREKINISSIVFLLESKDYIKYIKHLDPNAFISVTDVASVYGTLQSRWID